MKKINQLILSTFYNKFQNQNPKFQRLSSSIFLASVFGLPTSPGLSVLRTFGLPDYN